MRQTSMPRAGFEPAIPATKRPQTYALDRAATETNETKKITKDGVLRKRKTFLARLIHSCIQNA
jgi:hypothetical protein